ncbi:hypothetical protein AB0O68_02150 [Streptomyces sp. NPDC087512]|uniref:hypothetical protein n=1 Tax=Streptomyces sp. NPDC087512 TaxID=3155059 RepID=UPI003420A9C0
MSAKIGDPMQKLKKIAAVAVMVGGVGVVGSGVATANDHPFFIDNIQVASCKQSFEAGAGFAPVTVGPIGGDSTQNIGNFCSQVAVED